MKTVYALALLAVCASALAQDIVWTNKTVAFTNLQGQAFVAVELVRGDLDGVIWRKESSGGRVCYTNLAPELLEFWGIPTNRIEIARARAEHKAMSAAQYRAWASKQAQMDAVAKAKADAQEAALALLKARAAQMQADAQAIIELAQRIETTRNFQRHNQALADDYNLVHAGDPTAPYLSTSARDEAVIQDYEHKLQQMRADFARKYGSEP